MSVITNAEIRKIRSLREKKFRDEYGLFVVEGEKMVSEALSSGMNVMNVWYKDDIGEEAMSRISQFSTPGPALAVVQKPRPGTVPECSGLCLALDAVRDPGNMGTIIRLADWFGLNVLYVSPDCVDIYNSKVIQSTMGSIFRVKVFETDLPSLCTRFRDAGLEVCGTFLDGDNIYAMNLPSEGLIVMGNESNGISSEVGREVSRRMLIPCFSEHGPDSLNVSAAAAVTLSEFRRKRI